MPSINKLQISNFRNLSQESLIPGRVNLIAGDNGSGKSSILEAIYFLGMGRSFRNTQQTPLIQIGQRTCAVYGELSQGVTLGVSRSLDDSPQIRVCGEKAQGAAELAARLPLQLLNGEAFKLLEGGPKTRRQFIDWGVFHVEHQFHHHWREFRRCLQNRNILLKKKASRAEIAPWTEEFLKHAQEIDRQRTAYLEPFLPFLDATVLRLITLDGLDFHYYRGWNEDEGLAATLERSLDRDYMLGHTAAGPQRADLRIRLGTQPVSDILSRGQQKLLVSAMKLAQGAHLAQARDQQCVYMIDDLPAELDRENRQRVCRLLGELGGQLFLTGTDAEELGNAVRESGFASNEYKLFHVKHGRISDQEFTS